MRLDLALVERGLVRSRNQAARLITDGKVLVNNKVSTKASLEVSQVDVLQVSQEAYVARSANKLLHALSEFKIAVPKYCLDIGASTGGFTQVLLERGAEKVIALDVGTDQLAPELSQDSRVIEISGVNIRDIDPASLPISSELIQLVVVDLSFISLRLVASQIRRCAPSADFVVLIKPQFELQRKDLNSQGVVTDAARRRQGLEQALLGLSQARLCLLALCQSPITGGKGNIEYLAHLRAGEPVDPAPLLASLN